jgi:two-component system sensor histidine kinase PhoQ
MFSLRTRLILTASLVVSIFILAAGLALENAFYTSAQRSLQENLHGQLSLLMASAELNSSGDIDMPARLLDTKFSLPSSGLYGVIVDQRGTAIWKSLSTVGVVIPKPITLPAGDESIQTLNENDEDFTRLSYGLDWYTEQGKKPLTFNIIAELQPFNAQVYTFRRTLTAWLLGLGVALLLVQWAILVWGLRPLGTVRKELHAIDTGQQDRISGRYPTEIHLLTENINELLDHEHAQQSRYRHALADLAHSLKTPLAVLRGAIGELDQSANTKATLDEQVQRMDHIVAHQLQRAATAGAAPIRKSILLAPLIEKLLNALGKVYRDKGIQFAASITANTKLRVDEGDALELLGNLLDNACKWCQQRVTISAELQQQRVMFRISDDGPGVPDEKVQLILQRGGRIDQAVPGTGIGLTVAHEIIQTYQGQLHIERGPLGGADFCFDLPAGE